MLAGRREIKPRVLVRWLTESATSRDRPRGTMQREDHRLQVEQILAKTQSSLAHRPPCSKHRVSLEAFESCDTSSETIATANLRVANKLVRLTQTQPQQKERHGQSPLSYTRCSVFNKL